MATIAIAKKHHLSHKKAKEAAQKIADDLNAALRPRLQVARRLRSSSSARGLRARCTSAQDEVRLDCELGFLLSAAEADDRRRRSTRVRQVWEVGREALSPPSLATSASCRHRADRGTARSRRRRSHPSAPSRAPTMVARNSVRAVHPRERVEAALEEIVQRAPSRRVRAGCRIMASAPCDQRLPHEAVERRRRSRRSARIWRSRAGRLSMRRYALAVLGDA